MKERKGEDEDMAKAAEKLQFDLKTELDRLMKKAPRVECRDGKILLDRNNPDHRRIYERGE